jgi:hypothetical protein
MIVYSFAAPTVSTLGNDYKSAKKIIHPFGFIAAHLYNVEFYPIRFGLQSTGNYPRIVSGELYTKGMLGILPKDF